MYVHGELFNFLPCCEKPTSVAFLGMNCLHRYKPHDVLCNDYSATSLMHLSLLATLVDICLCIVRWRIYLIQIFCFRFATLVDVDFIDGHLYK
jgi:hypothetical protein